MSQLTITTTQNVTINFTAASVGERLLGQVLDLLVIIAYSVVAGYVIDYSGLGNYISSMDYWSEMAVYIVIYLPVNAPLPARLCAIVGVSGVVNVL